MQEKGRQDGLAQTVSTDTAANNTTASKGSLINNSAVQKIEAHYNYDDASKKINTGNTTPGELLAYATTLIGTPYKYGSIDPNVGFDCSGFITHVFNRFNIAVPRSSIDFTDVQREILLQQAKPGDLILFTGTDSTHREVGHMGIIITNDNNQYSFIHSTSGKQYGVTITPLNQYYMGRFLKVVRVFKQNDEK
jgi:cell wall-associated NlpC family hydrolase